MSNNDALDWDLAERDAWLAREGYDDQDAPVETIVEADE